MTTLAYLRAVVAAKYRVMLARADLHSQIGYTKRLARELEEAKAAIPVLARALQDRTSELRQIHADRRSPVDHITSRSLVP